MAITDTQKQAMTAPVRDNLKPYLTVFEYDYGTTKIYSSENHLKSFTIERVGDETKFFGYGIIQRLNAKLINIPVEEVYKQFKTSSYITIDFDFEGVKTRFANTPRFWVSEVHRDAVTGEISVTAYDSLYTTTHLTVGGEGTQDEENFVYRTIPEMASILADGMRYGFPTAVHGESSYENFFTASLPELSLSLSNNKYAFPEFTWNLDGTETYRDVLDDIAEVHHAIYYLEPTYNGERIVFHRFHGYEYNEPALEITGDDYFDCTIKSYRRMGDLTHATVLGDNITGYANTAHGTHIYIRDNAIFSLMDGTTVSNYLNGVTDFIYKSDEAPELAYTLNGWTIGQFECTWRGNPFLKIADVITVYDRNDEEWINGYILNDVIEYDGTFKQKTQWNYKGEDEESASNPPTVGEVLKQTYAHVDKVNQNITQVVHTQDEHEEQITTLVTEAGNISASVVTMQNGLEETLEGINGTFDTLTKKVEAAVTADDVQISIEKELSNGVEKVSTKTGYTFDEEGLTIAKSNSEMSTQITDDGMTVFRSGEAVLIANNEGVQAEDLHATTYLIIGNNSRFEDMGSDRTACFWIGG